MNSEPNLNTPANRSNKVCKTIVILGSSEVGKSNIIQRYAKKRFDESYWETIGVDYFSKEIPSNAGNVVLSIWDTSGSEIDLKILPSNIYKIASAFIIVCSYDKKDSLQMLKNYIFHLQSYSANQRTINNFYMLPVIILVNKCDLKKESRQFKICDVTKLVNDFSMNIFVYEVSAKENTKLDLVFQKLVNFVSGRFSSPTDNTLDTTYGEEENRLSAENAYTGRKRSFVLKEIKNDKKMHTHTSCCN